MNKGVEIVGLIQASLDAPAIKEANGNIIKRADVQGGGTLVVPRYISLRVFDVITVHAVGILIPIAVQVVRESDENVDNIEIEIPKFYFSANKIALYYVITRVVGGQMLSATADYEIID